MPTRRTPQATAQPAADADAGPGPKVDAFRPLTRRRRLLVGVLTVVTVVVGTVLMFRPHQRLMGAKAARAEADRLAACPPGAASAAAGCPGSLLPVVVVPPGQAASR